MTVSEASFVKLVITHPMEPPRSIEREEREGAAHEEETKRLCDAEHSIYAHLDIVSDAGRIYEVR